METKNYMDFLQKNILRELAAKASEHAPEGVQISSDNVMENLTFIWEEIKEKQFGQETGRVLKFMPKRYKEMVLRLIAPTAAFNYSMEKVESLVICKALLYLDRLDNKPIAIGQASVSLTDTAVSNEGGSGTAAIQSAEALAKGLAESKAMQKLGIGIWFSYDLEEENSEKIISDAQNRDALNPVVINPESSVPASSASQNENAIKEETTATEPEQAVADPAPVPEPEPKKAVKNKAKNPTTISLEEAKALPADIGKAKSKGWTLGETAVNAPANLVWMYNQEACRNKDAILVIAKSDESIASCFKKYNIEI